MDNTSLDPSLNIFFPITELYPFSRALKEVMLPPAGKLVCWAAGSALSTLLHFSLALWDLGRVIYTQKESAGKLGASHHFPQLL